VEAIYHRQVLERAIGRRVSARALAAMQAANIGQDSLWGLLHFVYHFDNSLIAEGLAYMERCRTEAARASDPTAAWAAFGRLSHAAADFYSHSNYVALWHASQSRVSEPPIESIDGLDPALLNHPRLITGRIYWADVLYLFEHLRPLARRWAPADSHVHMNLDNPERGPLFPYSLEAAVQRTLAEFERTLAAIGEERGEAAMRAFCDR
jgi:hypothetical protein